MTTSEDATPAVDTAALTAIMNGGELMFAIAEMLGGFRKKLKDGGIGDEAADTMTKDLYDTLSLQWKSAIAGNAAKSILQQAGSFAKRGR